MSKNELDTWLRSCPRDRADTGFTQEVMGRITRNEPSPWRITLAWPRLALTATAAAVVLLAFGLWQADRGQQAARDQALLKELRAEYAAITDELEELKRDPSQLPVVYLGGTERVDLVLDLERLRQSRLPPTALTVSQPAAHRVN